MKLSIVSTLYNSSQYIEDFIKKIYESIEVLNVNEFEIIIVNDGSKDDSLQKIIEIKKKHKHIKILDLARNFGHHKALYAGLKYSKGELVFLIDSDLEESPELLIEYWESLNINPEYDVVYGVQNKRKGGFFERISGKIFYKILNILIDFKYPINTLTARLMKRDYVNAVLEYNEKTLELWSVFSINGFNNLEIISKKTSKQKTEYTLTKKINMALETITSTSVRPLIFIFLIGIFMFLFSVFMILKIIIYYFFFNHDIESSYSSLIASVWFIGGLTIVLLGIIAIYLSKIFLEVKNRPLYHIKKIY